MVSVLFLCTGNICRSPTAEAVFRKIVNERGLTESVSHDSAGTHGYHIGEKPDFRSCDVSIKHGVNMSDLVARKFLRKDFDDFDYIVAMDSGHKKFARQMKHVGAKAQVVLLLDYDPDYTGQDVPDPYYGGTQDFLHTYKLIDLGVRALADKILVK